MRLARRETVEAAVRCRRNQFFTLSMCTRYSWYPGPSLPTTKLDKLYFNTLYFNHLEFFLCCSSKYSEEDTGDNHDTLKFFNFKRPFSQRDASLRRLYLLFPVTC